MSSFTIRPYCPETDNVGLLHVANELAIPARARIGLDRSPDFTAFSGVLNDPFEVLVAETNGNIIGFIEFSYQHFSLFGQTTKGVHASLGGILPEWRRRGVMKALFREALHSVKTKGVQWAYVLINDRNNIIRKGIGRFFPGTIALPKLLVHGVVLPWKPILRRPAFSCEIGPLEDSEWHLLLDFWEKQMQQYDLFPLYEPSKWLSLPGCRKEDYHVARDADGNIMASLGSWSPFEFKRHRIHKYDPLEGRLLFHPVNNLLHLLGIRPFPKEGGVLRSLYTLRPLALPGMEAALGLLFNRLRWREKNYNMVFLAFPEGDPRNRLIKNYIRFTNINIPLLVPLTPDFQERLQSNPPGNMYIEYAFI